MRIHVDLRSHLGTGGPSILQVDNEPVLGATGQVAVNGKYLIAAPSGLDFPVDTDSYVLDGAGEIDGGDVSSEGFARMLASYPQFGHIYFNPLLTDDHVDELDFTFSFTDPGTVNVFTPRVQTGREASAVTETGQMPMATAVLPLNDSVTPNRPGLLVTDAIDIGPYTLDCDGNEVGTDEFMLQWKLYGFSITQDIAADFGAQAGTNTPALRYLQEVEQEPTGFSAYISIDGGASWCEVGLLEPVAFCEKTTEVLIAFKNTGSSKVYIANYALLF